MNSTTLQQTGQAQFTPGTGRRLGLIAGTGKLPAILAASAREKGYDVIGLSLTAEGRELIEPHCLKSFEIAPGQIGRSLKLLRNEDVNELVFIGKMPKLDLLRQVSKLDWTAVRELSRLPNLNDDTIQRGMADFAARQGMRVLTQTEFLRHIFPEVGVITRREPTADEYADIEYGLKIAKNIARLDIGQTVVVKDRMILAVEAIEGTDEAIKRGVALARGPVVVVKVARSDHDMRFDVPTVGMNTLESMIAPNPGGVLAIGAGETMVVEQEELAAFADSHGIAIVAI